MGEDNNLTEIFCRLASTPSPSLSELEVARIIKRELDGIGIQSHFDKSAKRTESNTGNLIARIGKGKPVLLFSAHMDTVEDGKKPIKPIISKGIIRSDGSTIVGSDDKSGVTAMIGALRKLKDQDNLPTTFFVFTTTEEEAAKGKNMGIAYLDMNSPIDFAFAIDGSDRPGKFIRKALGYNEFAITIKGKAAHAALRPEKGADAVKAAGIIIANLEIGKAENGSSLSIGRVSGGGASEATVPENAELAGTLRGFTYNDMDRRQKHVMQVVERACKATGCKYKIKFKRSFAPPFLLRSERIIELARGASEASGLKFELMDLYTTTEANVLSDRGWETLGMCRGGRNAHSTKEYVAIGEVEKTAELIANIVKGAKMYAMQAKPARRGGSGI